MPRYSASDRPEVRACGSCHRAEGTGGPENASLAGLPAAYIIQQIEDYKSGARKFAGPLRHQVDDVEPVGDLAEIALGRTDDRGAAALQAAHVASPAGVKTG